MIALVFNLHCKAIILSQMQGVESCRLRNLFQGFHDRTEVSSIPPAKIIKLTNLFNFFM